MTSYRHADVTAEGITECSDCGALIAPQGQRQHTQLHNDIKNLQAATQLLERSMAKERGRG
jgi:hypothetical protein